MSTGEKDLGPALQKGITYDVRKNQPPIRPGLPISKLVYAGFGHSFEGDYDEPVKFRDEAEIVMALESFLEKGYKLKPKSTPPPPETRRWAIIPGAGMVQMSKRQAEERMRLLKSQTNSTNNQSDTDNSHPSMRELEERYRYAVEHGLPYMPEELPKQKPKETAGDFPDELRSIIASQPSSSLDTIQFRRGTPLYAKMAALDHQKEQRERQEARVKEQRLEQERIRAGEYFAKSKFRELVVGNVSSVSGRWKDGRVGIRVSFNRRYDPTGNSGMESAIYISCSPEGTIEVEGKSPILFGRSSTTVLSVSQWMGNIGTQKEALRKAYKNPIQEQYHAPPSESIGR